LSEVIAIVEHPEGTAPQNLGFSGRTRAIALATSDLFKILEKTMPVPKPGNKISAFLYPLQELLQEGTNAHEVARADLEQAFIRAKGTKIHYVFTNQ
jgi:hypothetical protein